MNHTAANSRTTIRNKHPRLDTDGNVVDCHESSIERFGNRYYMYGMGYGEHSGWTADNLMTCYSSANLIDWTNHGPLYPPGGITIPVVKYNAATKCYVMWLAHWQSKQKSYFTAAAETPTGPFDEPVPARTHGGFGDYSLFIDDDGSGYIAYTASCGDRSRPREMHQIWIERLTDDYRNGTGETCGPLAWNCESPVMFKRNDLYYILFDNTCCWNPNGTGCRVYTASSPLGPYEYRGDINRNVADDPRKIVSKNGDTSPGDGRTDVNIPMQTRRVAELMTTDGPKLMLTGDRWGSADDGKKGHDYVYWTSPLRFDDDGMIQMLRWEDEWSIELVSPASAI